MVRGGVLRRALTSGGASGFRAAEKEGCRGRWEGSKLGRTLPDQQKKMLYLVQVLPLEERGAW